MRHDAVQAAADTGAAVAARCPDPAKAVEAATFVLDLLGANGAGARVRVERPARIGAIVVVQVWADGAQVTATRGVAA